MKVLMLTLMLTGTTAVLAQSDATNAPSAPLNAPTNAPAATEPTHSPAPPATAQPAPPPEGAPAPASATVTSAGTNAPAEAVAPEAAPSEPILLPNGEPGLRLNFRGASLETVLNYLSEAAGFVIVLDTQVRGKVDVWSNTPVSKDEAVNILNSVLSRNGYAAIRNERTLTIVNRDEAKTRDIPVRSGYDPTQMPRTDEIVTQVIPIRYTEAVQLIKDLQPLVATSTPMTANESGNAIVITDTQANIRRVAEIIQAIDTGSEAVTEVRVFKLGYADPTEMADLLGSLFPDESRSSGGGQSQAQFGFRRFFGGPQPTSSGGGANQRVRSRSRVIAVADPRTSSVVVSAARELIDQIAAMVEQLDANPARKQTVRVYQLENADAQDVSDVLQEMFQRNQTSANRNTANRNSTLRNRSTQTQQSTTSSQRSLSGGRTGGGFN
jgi:general secretion pathway protein D